MIVSTSGKLHREIRRQGIKVVNGVGDKRVNHSSAGLFKFVGKAMYITT